MEESFRLVAANIALALEFLVIVAICVGAAETIVHAAAYLFQPSGAAGARRRLWLGFARWLILALEFALAADIVRTAIAPTWTEIGQLAAIAAIRTGLGFFLERDIEAFRPSTEAD